MDGHRLIICYNNPTTIKYTSNEPASRNSPSLFRTAPNPQNSWDKRDIHISHLSTDYGFPWFYPCQTVWGWRILRPWTGVEGKIQFNRAKPGALNVVGKGRGRRSKMRWTNRPWMDARRRRRSGGEHEVARTRQWRWKSGGAVAGDIFGEDRPSYSALFHGPSKIGHGQDRSPFCKEKLFYSPKQFTLSILLSK